MNLSEQLDLIRQLDIMAWRALPDGETECLSQVAAMAKECILELQKRFSQEERFKWAANKRVGELERAVQRWTDNAAGYAEKGAALADAMQKYVDHFGDPLKCARSALDQWRMETRTAANNNAQDE